MQKASHTNAVSATDLASTAGKKAAKVQRKLKAAEAELSRTNMVLVKELPPSEKKIVAEALKDNQAAEEKVREAADELEVVSELLSDAQEAEAASNSGNIKTAPTPGKTGQGTKSIIPHLRSDAASKPTNPAPG
ncbi:MAG: hypothetical protein ABIU58_12625 [Ramlibacter sp.]